MRGLSNQASSSVSLGWRSPSRERVHRKTLSDGLSPVVPGSEVQFAPVVGMSLLLGRTLRRPSQWCLASDRITRLPWYRAHIAPSARSVSRCRSSDWEPSAFGTRASPACVVNGRSGHFRAASRSRALRFSGAREGVNHGEGTVKLTKSSSIDPQDTGLRASREPAMLGIRNGRQPQLDNTLVAPPGVTPHN